MTQLDLLTYPHTAGYRDRDTSRQAAVAVEPKAKIIRQKVLDYLRTGVKATAEQIAEAIGEDRDNVKPRCTELSKPQVNLVRDSGLRGLTRNRKPCIVWEAV